MQAQPKAKNIEKTILNANTKQNYEFKRNKLAQTAYTAAKIRNNDKHSFVCNLKMHILLSASLVF